MAIAEPDLRAIPDSPARPCAIRWTKAEYYRMGEVGLFDNRRVELLGGEIYEMSPIGVRHIQGVYLVTKALERAFGQDVFVLNQSAFDAGEEDEPVPDITVITEHPRDLTEIPDTAVLVVEVADSSLRYDRGHKASLYARTGVADYWIVNLNENVVEVYRRPAPQEAQPFGAGYDETRIYRPGESVAPLAAPGVSVAVSDLLP